MRSSKTAGSHWAALAAVVGALGVAAAGAADDYGYYNTDNDLLWGVIHMPDFDQKRDAGPGILGLPGDGSQYCVPTSTMNVLAYIARHGYPGLEPGVMQWTSGDVAIYNDLTGNLQLLGGVMGTGASSGTSSTGWSLGTAAWFNGSGFTFFFDHYTRLAKEGQAVTTRRMAKTGLNGGLVMACFGRWNHDGINLTTRASGHCVTPIRIDTTGLTTSLLYYRDPGTGGASEMSQSGYATTILNMVDELYFIGGAPVYLSRMDLNPPPDSRLRLFDKYYTIFPKQGLTDLPSPPRLVLSAPTPLTPDFSDVVINALGGAITGLMQAPSRNFWAYTADGDAANPRGVYHVDPLSGQVSLLQQMLVVRGMTFGRDERLYVLDRDQIKCFRPDDDDMLVFELDIPLPTGHTFGGGISYDDLTDEIVMLAVGSESVLRFASGDPMAPPDVKLLPTSIPLTGLRGIQVDPTDGDLWVLSDGSLREITTDPVSDRLVPGALYTPPAHRTLVCFSIDSQGHFFLNHDGRISEWQYVVGAGFQQVVDSPFNGMQAGGCFAMSLCRTNFDPVIHSRLGWNTDMPAEEAVVGSSVPDCPADWDGDLMVNVFDLLAYLDDWFADSIEADMDGNQTIDVFDLLAYLDLWFPGC